MHLLLDGAAWVERVEGNGFWACTLLLCDDTHCNIPVAVIWYSIRIETPLSVYSVCVGIDTHSIDTPDVLKARPTYHAIVFCAACVFAGGSAPGLAAVIASECFCT